MALEASQLLSGKRPAPRAAAPSPFVFTPSGRTSTAAPVVEAEIVSPSRKAPTPKRKKAPSKTSGLKVAAAKVKTPAPRRTRKVDSAPVLDESLPPDLGVDIPQEELAPDAHNPAIATEDEHFAEQPEPRTMEFEVETDVEPAPVEEPAPAAEHPQFHELALAPQPSMLRDVVSGKATLAIPSWLFLTIGFLALAYVASVSHDIATERLGELPPAAVYASVLIQITMVVLALITCGIGVWRTFVGSIRRKVAGEIFREMARHQSAVQGR